jgi:hypothetical protein
MNTTKSMVMSLVLAFSITGCGLNTETRNTIPAYSEVDIGRINDNLQTVRERMMAAKLEGKFTDQEWGALSEFDITAKIALSRYKIMLMTDGKYADKVELLAIWNNVAGAYAKARSQVVSKWDTLPESTRASLTQLDKEASEISVIMQEYSNGGDTVDTKAIADKTLKVIWIAMQITAAVL